MMIDFLSGYISYWPLSAFVALLLAGFNLPISEDAIIIFSATLAHEDCSLFWPSYIAIYAGIIVSDIISYFWGYLLSHGLLNISCIKKKLSPQKIRWVSHRLEKHGFFTFITVRFVPLGLRNVLFMSSGFINLPLRKFMLFDCVAAVISSSTLYFLVYLIGVTGSRVIKICGGVLLFIIALLVISFIRKASLEMSTDSADSISESADCINE